MFITDAGDFLVLLFMGLQNTAEGEDFQLVRSCVYFLLPCVMLAVAMVMLLVCHLVGC